MDFFKTMYLFEKNTDRFFTSYFYVLKGICFLPFSFVCFLLFVPLTSTMVFSLGKAKEKQVFPLLFARFLVPLHRI